MCANFPTLGELIRRPMSGSELQRYLPKTCIWVYPDFASMSSIDDALGAEDDCVFLYETSQGFGHWCALFKQNGSAIEVFDSYGYIPDDELMLIPKHFRKVNNESRPHLSWLLQSSPYKIHYNPFRLQSDAADVSTCGRHCVARLWHRHLTINQYADRLAKLKSNGITPDQYVAMLVSS
jgi:hypothetical protein